MPKAAIQSVMDAFQKANSGLTVKINTIDHNSFQENINNYLQGSPDDVFMWFAGYRMRFFASRASPATSAEAWKNIQGMTDALKKSSTGEDGKQYFVPSTYYPWALFYRKSVFAKHGYEVPKTIDELTALGAQMKKDGLVPIAFGDKDGWPAMGTFDQLNLRVNGYDFHVSLMAGEEAWNSDKVKKVFDTWAGLLRCTSRTRSGAPGRKPPRRCSRARPGCTCSARSSPSSSSRAPSRTTSTSSPSRRSTRHRLRRHRGAHRRLHDVQAAQERGRRLKLLSYVGTPRRRTSSSRPTRASSRRTRTPTSPATPPCRRSRSSS